MGLKSRINDFVAVERSGKGRMLRKSLRRNKSLGVGKWVGLMYGEGGTLCASN